MAEECLGELQEGLRGELSVGEELDRSTRPLTQDTPEEEV
jgi:hypothetical protein